MEAAGGGRGGAASGGGRSTTAAPRVCGRPRLLPGLTLPAPRAIVAPWLHRTGQAGHTQPGQGEAKAAAAAAAVSRAAHTVLATGGDHLLFCA